MSQTRAWHNQGQRRKRGQRPRSRRLRSLAGDTVVVAIEVSGIPRVAPIQRCHPGRPGLGAVGITCARSRRCWCRCRRRRRGRGRCSRRRSGGRWRGRGWRCRRRRRGRAGRSHGRRGLLGRGGVSGHALLAAAPGARLLRAVREVADQPQDDEGRGSQLSVFAAVVITWSRRRFAPVRRSLGRPDAVTRGGGSPGMPGGQAAAGRTRWPSEP